MRIDDDRTPEQKRLFNLLVVGTDAFMSGWGLAKNGVSFAAWATDEKNLKRTVEMVERRQDLKRVRIVDGRTYKPRGEGHLHIYMSHELVG